ncbi:MAG: AraC family transcriptional regulator, partial [Verrucomicrobiota bacterium]
WASEGRTVGRAHRAIVVQFTAEVIPSALRALGEFKDVASLLSRSARGLHFRGVAVAGLERELRAVLKLRGLQAWIALLQILARLAVTPARPLTSLRFAPDLPLTQQARLQRALAYIEAHNEPGLALREVARAAGVSPATLVRMFRRMLGRSFVAYVTELRVGRVCRQLMDTELGVAEIAYACGFNNLANFNRCFRALKGTTPTTFRRRYVR